MSDPKLITASTLYISHRIRHNFKIHRTTTTRKSYRIAFKGFKVQRSTTTRKSYRIASETISIFKNKATHNMPVTTCQFLSTTQHDQHAQLFKIKM